MDVYEELAQQLPNEVQVGGALITLVEPHIGFEQAYNRWYEDDHFYSGVMHGPWAFSGRRFVATRDLRRQRIAVADALAQPPDAGCYMSIYWITAGHEREQERWAFHAMTDQLMPNGRGFTERSHVYTAYHRFRFSVRRDPGPLKAETALAHPFAGLVVEVVDCLPGVELGALQRWFEVDDVPATLSGSPIGICVGFEPNTQGAAAGGGEGAQRLCLLWFLDCDPRECFPSVFAAHHRALESSGLGELRFAGPFVPTIPGTDRYVAELR